MPAFAFVLDRDEVVAGLRRDETARRLKYARTPEGKATQARANKRYRATEKGREAVKRDGRSVSHAAAQLKYSRSAKGKEAVARWRNSSKGRAYLEEQALAVK